MPRKVEKMSDLQRQLETLSDQIEPNPSEARSLLARVLLLKVSGSNNLTTILKCVSEIGKLLGLYVEKKVVKTEAGKSGGDLDSEWLADARSKALKLRKEAPSGEQRQA